MVIVGAALDTTGAGGGAAAGAGDGAGGILSGGDPCETGAADTAPPPPPPPHPCIATSATTGRSALTESRPLKRICRNPPAQVHVGRCDLGVRVQLFQRSRRKMRPRKGVSVKRQTSQFNQIRGRGLAGNRMEDEIAPGPEGADRASLIYTLPRAGGSSAARS